MNSQRSRLTWALVLAASAFISCGGGETSVGIDGTGHTEQIVAYGRLRGFGSIEINGVRYDTAGATFLIDGAAGSQADIGLGDILFVDGRIEAGASSAVAQTVMADRVLHGKVETLDASGGLLIALGQTVLVDAETQFEAALAGGLAGLSIGDAVRVSGFRDVQGAIVATRIARQNASAVTLKTTGAVTSIDAATQLLTIGGLVVDYGNAELLPADAASQLAPGVFVEVKLTSQDASGTFAATTVELRRQRVQGDTGSRADIEGYVTRHVASNASAFDIDGLPVITTSTTELSGSVSADKRVMVSGSLDAGGTVVARRLDGTNRAPVAANASVSTTEDTELTGQLPAATDPDGDAVVYGLYREPSRGFLRVEASGSYSYTPYPNLVGTDGFSYRVTDGRGGQRFYWVTVTTIPLLDDDAPVQVGAPLAVSVGEGIASIPSPSQCIVDLSGLEFQPDGKMLVMGEQTEDFGCSALIRLHPDGTLDSGFGNAGLASPRDIDARLPLFYGFAFDTSGKILLAGIASDGTGAASALARLDVDGAPDRAFGGGTGFVTTNLSPGHDEAWKAWPLSDGKILTSGVSRAGDSELFPLVRYNHDGSLDTSFGGGDGVKEGLAAPIAYAPRTVQPDGRILVVGPRSDDDPAIVLRRYNADGDTLDASFGGGDGIVESAVSGHLTLQPDGRILLAGCGTNGDLRLQRFNADGTIDAGFGSGGLVAGVDERSGCIRRVTVLPDSKFLVMRPTTEYPWLLSNRYVLLRFGADGALDNSFGFGGILALGSRPPIIAVQPDGRIILAWSIYLNGLHLQLMRLLPDGKQDLSFGVGNPLYLGQPFSRTIPAGTFTDADGDALTYAATLADGSPLPVWLQFNAATHTFSGTPLAGATNPLYIKVTATDPTGRSVSDIFGLRVLVTP
jgi:uncharacterized delta-60 repeat protein